MCWANCLIFAWIRLPSLRLHLDDLVLLTQHHLEDLGLLRLHCVFVLIVRLIDSSLLDNRILSPYHLLVDFERVYINCVYDVLDMLGHWIDLSPG